MSVGLRRGWLKLLAGMLPLWWAGCCGAQSLELAPQPVLSLWKDGVGNGFNRGVQTLTFEAGANYGVEMLGGREKHHLALLSLSYGHMWGDVAGEGHWYRGNFEWRAELFGGVQFSPDDDWVVGLTPHVRYNFATGTRWVPFVDFGAGVSATGIGSPDLSGTFEFNLQGSTGVHWFIRDNLAVTVEARYLHMSCAGIHKPNLGLNGVAGFLGLTWFF
jgi:lipid A 3-O-deacylase